MAYNNNIHISILGPVSAGKSTFLNSLFSNTFSEMKRKKTTMLPQIYQTTSIKEEINTTEEIYQMNQKSNEIILKLREENKYTQADFKELIYKVSPIPDFINLPDPSATYSILDMPGLNCGGGDNMYFNYIQQISKDIDVYILVFDINSSLNTTDEVNILTMIAKEIEKNKHGYVHILINKCDDVEYTGDTFKFTDDELQELYDTCFQTANKYLKDARGKITISPICSSDLYVFRGIKNNIESIDEKHLDKIIINECGKKELSKLKTIQLKRKFMYGLLLEKESYIYNDWMKDTGYNLFQLNLNDILNKTNYIKIVKHHILMKLNEILFKPITDFDIVSCEMVLINLSIQNLSSVSKPLFIENDIDIKKVLDAISLKINEYLCKGVDSYSGSTVEIADSFIDKLGSFWNKIKNLFYSDYSDVVKPINPFQTTQEKLKEKRLSLLNLELNKKYNENIFKELYDKKMITPEKFKVCIINSLKINDENRYITIVMINLLTSISKITKNNDEYTHIVLFIFFDLEKELIFSDIKDFNDLFMLDSLYSTGLDKLEYHAGILDLLKLVSKIVNKDDLIDIIFDVLKKYFVPNISKTNIPNPIDYTIRRSKIITLPTSKSVSSLPTPKSVSSSYDYELEIKPLTKYPAIDLLYSSQLSLYALWISNNMYKINQNEKLGYLYYKIMNIKYGSLSLNQLNGYFDTLPFEGYVNINKRMENLYQTLKEIFSDEEDKKLDKKVDKKLSSVSSLELIVKEDVEDMDGFEELEEDTKTKLKTKLKITKDETEDGFIDAENHSDTSEDYEETDDATTVYKKTSTNAQVRMNKTLKKGDT